MKTIIIAEAGVNHNGDFETAKKMIVAAKEAGADYVKFQTAVPELVISEFAPQAEYQKENTGVVESQLDMCRKIHLPLSAYKPLSDFCSEVGIGFMSTPFDLTSIDLLAEIGQDYFKIPSGEITNLPYLRKIAGKGVPVILSTGMSTIEEIEEAIQILTGSHPTTPEGFRPKLTRSDIMVLHCNTQYPTPYSDINLRAMQTLADELDVRTGFSDHSLGIEAPIAAVAMGACVIEKHFTLSREMVGPDHKASLEPDELKAMVTSIRHIEEALGDGVKRVTDSERPNIEIARKSIVAIRPIKKGEILTEENIYVKRPGNGVSPMLWDQAIGSEAVRDFAPDELIEL
ncbi:MAG: N-acetylneuraminate synthase [Muribaculaceae bacterium]|nr:N-acetylneuraminate synthase [Muribaculaceae bacterium]